MSDETASVPAASRDPLTLLPAGLEVDASRRTTAGIRITMAPRVAEPGATYGAWQEDAALHALEYVVVDVETTGGSPGRGHRVTEVAAVRVRADGTVLREYATLINPERSIPPFITALTNITAEMVADAPRFAEVVTPLRGMLSNAVFVAHNAGFDRRFIDAELAQSSLGPCSNPVLCTVRMARRLVPELRSRSLDALASYFGIANDARHRAHGDARATALILVRLLQRAMDQDVTSWRQLDELLTRRSVRRRRRAAPAPVPDA